MFLTAFVVKELPGNKCHATGKSVQVPFRLSRIFKRCAPAGCTAGLNMRVGVHGKHIWQCFFVPLFFWVSGAGSHVSDRQLQRYQPGQPGVTRKHTPSDTQFQKNTLSPLFTACCRNNFLCWGFWSFYILISMIQCRCQKIIQQAVCLYDCAFSPLFTARLYKSNRGDTRLGVWRCGSRLGTTLGFTRDSLNMYTFL